MSELRLGGLLVDTIGQLKVGSSNVQKAYVGSVQVFPASSTTTTSTTSTTTTTLIPTTTTTSTTTSTTTPVPTTTTTSTTTSTTTPAPLPYSYTLYYDYNDGLPIVVGFTLPTDACNATNSFIVYSNSSTFSAGATLYYDLYGTVPISTVPYTFSQSYYKEGSNYVTFETDGYTVRSITICVVPTTTTTTSTTTSTTTCAPQNAQSMYYNYDTGLPTMFGTSSTNAACNLIVSASTIYYASSLALTNGTPLYHDECLTIPITASAYTDASQQYFKIGPYYVNFETNGYVVRDIAVCPEITTSTTTSTTTAAPTVTINWDVREVGSGAVRLVIYDSTATPILDEESQGSGPLNGSITTSNTPFTVAVSRTAGTEVAQYRICNDSVGSEITHDYSVTSEVTYVVDPTPLTTSVFATYGDSNTPMNCSVA